ncbi:SusC/RagA family TonB-linked outer membrane protein [Hymenobacter sp. BT186]|uniref:SusC/RagA family TonB-linked outer membrane protein n=1 Tax=Hymenobacter telluris TaxID=2816474 RepID=A0A939EWC2_9BACT|nr:SusC/RagA family TonB-linked outer membrane protein [Hymenobacter telluris]MBO0358710.1 SusC/RagA family TonB-linked outer membrane protein [Hymenobacter telluris]MBW3374736.1 SusC/RagA family TonB-linked outer membrane protein [Hymenobacter norwichensis]
MKKSLLLVPLVLTSLAQQAAAQTRTISGKVTDQATGQGLPGVTVLAKGTTIGTSTDADGAYRLDIPSNTGSLSFSFVGYNTVEQTVRGGTLNISMSTDTKQLNEVVVSALGLKENKDELGTATSRVTGAAVAQSGETSVINGLSAKASGVAITRSNGDPGAGSYIQIRGQNTINGETQPLIVIDGVPMFNTSEGVGSQGTYTAGVAQQSRLNDINPNDIASVQVLKGAAAAALWGSRASNGVIVITTKRGNTEAGKLSVTYGATYSIDRISYKHDLQDTYGRGSGGVAAQGISANANSWGDKISTRSGAPDDVSTTQGYFVAADGDRYYPTIRKNSTQTFLKNNFDEVFHTGSFLENNLSLSAGNRESNVFVSLSDLNQKGIIRNNSDYRRSTARVNAERRFNKVVRLSGASTYSRITSNRIQQGSNTSGLYLGLLRTSPDFDQTDYIGTYFSPTGEVGVNRHRAYRNQIGQDPNPQYNNALWTMKEQKNPNTVDRFIGSTELGLDPLPWLSMTARFGADFYAEMRRDLYPINSAENAGLGSATEEAYSENQLNGDIFARATHSFSEKFSGTLLVGMNLNQRILYNYGATYGRFLLDVRDQSFFSNATSENTQAFDYESKRRNSAGYTSLNLVYNEQLFLNATGRLENASTFGRDTQNRFFYPSVDLAWQFTKLPLLLDNKVLSFGKIRAAYGRVGLEPGLYVVRDVYGSSGSSDGFGVQALASAFNGSFSRSSVRGNSQLRPERKEEVEVGADLRFLQDRITLGGTYYRNLNTDVIIARPTSPSSGYSNESANAAKIRNRGVEIDLNADVLKMGDFTWNVGGNWFTNRNVVLDVAGAENIALAGFVNTQAVVVKNQPFSTLWGSRWNRDDAGELIIDANGFPTVAATPGIIGNPNPDWKMGLNTTLSYKGLRLYALVDRQQGGDIWAGTEGVLRFFGVSKYTDVETTLSPDDAAITRVISGGTIASTVAANADGTYSFRGRLGNFGAGPVALNEAWYNTIGGGFTGAAEQNIQDATWMRLRELTLGYNLNSEGFRNFTKLSNIEFTLTGRNLILWTKEFKGVDPETNLTGQSAGRGLEYFNNPGTRSFLISLKLTY